MSVRNIVESTADLNFIQPYDSTSRREGNSKGSRISHHNHPTLDAKQSKHGVQLMSASKAASMKYSAGAAFLSSGLTSACYNPLDCLRVRWQVAGGQGQTQTQRSLWTFGSHILKHEGLVQGLWRPGLFPNAMGMAMSGSIRFGLYEMLRDSLSEEKNIVTIVTAASLCGCVAYGVSTPFHLMKTMEQALMEKKSLEANKPNLSKRGLPILWKGSIPLMGRGACFTCGQMLGYDGMKTFVLSKGFLEDGVQLHILSSVTASLGASILSAPADILMTKYMTSGFPELGFHVRRILDEHGILGFWRGWSVSFLRLVPVMLTYSTLYEQTRFQLGIGYFT